MRADGLSVEAGILGRQAGLVGSSPSVQMVADGIRTPSGKGDVK